MGEPTSTNHGTEHGIHMTVALSVCTSYTRSELHQNEADKI